MSEAYILEYGRDCLEMHVGAVEANERALVVDDLVATGGTLCAAINLLGIFLQPLHFVRLLCPFKSRSCLKIMDPISSMVCFS